MFNNIANKIKGLAKVVAFLGTTIGVVYLIISIINYANNSDCISYAGTGGLLNSDILRKAGDKALAGLNGIYLSISMIVFSLLSTFPLYGFGQIVDNSDNALLLQKENNRILNSLYDRNSSSSCDK